MKDHGDQGDLFNYGEGRRRADKGAERALNHAERVHDNWLARAMAELDLFTMRKGTGATFMAEEVREEAYARGLARPPDNRAWGAVMKKAADSGRITWQRYGRAKAKNCHCNPKGVWRINEWPLIGPVQSAGALAGPMAPLNDPLKSAIQTSEVNGPA